MLPLSYRGMSPVEVMERVAKVLQQYPRVQILELSENYLHATFTTRWLRFVDDVEFWADHTTALLHFRSASRVGYSDLGANSRRMEQVAQRLMEVGFAPSKAVSS